MDGELLFWRDRPLLMLMIYSTKSAANSCCCKYLYNYVRVCNLPVLIHNEWMKDASGFLQADRRPGILYVTITATNSVSLCRQEKRGNSFGHRDPDYSDPLFALFCMNTECLYISTSLLAAPHSSAQPRTPVHSDKLQSPNKSNSPWTKHLLLLLLWWGNDLGLVVQQELETQLMKSCVYHHQHSAAADIKVLRETDVHIHSKKDWSFSSRAALLFII